MWSRVEGAIADKVHRPATIWVFQKVIYAWMMLHALYLWPMHEILWGHSSWQMPTVVDAGFVANMVFWLNYHPEHGVMVWWVYVVSVAVSLSGFLGIVPRVLVFVCGQLMLYSANYVFNSGFYLMQFFGFFLIAASPNARHWFRISLTNLGFWACRLQFVLVYAEAAFFKWRGTTWLNGSAMFYAAHLDHFVRKPVADLLMENRVLSMVLTYSALAYQTVFPILVWFKKLRLPLLLVGIGFHGFIAIGMTLPEFGLAMIAGYTLFIKEDMALKIVRKLKVKKFDTVRTVPQ
ncbi:MAG: hypothetical protein GC193_06215 [Cryomorphaceae bacterium]|nr:hypothetical protein [Cryomorphaceae bacterium]